MTKQKLEAVPRYRNFGRLDVTDPKVNLKVTDQLLSQKVADANIITFPYYLLMV